MSEEILINISPQETRVSQLENGVLQELYLERSNHRGVVNNIYMGKVVRVMPGMEAAFIDIGLERAAFLHVSDIVEAFVPASQDTESRRKTITEVVREGQKLLVQVAKEPLGTKGARLTTQLTIASRYLVLMPKDQSIGLSAKIEDETERERLRGIMDSLFPGELQYGYIVRTIADGAGEADFRKDALFLDKLWQEIQERVKQVGTGELVHQDLPLEKRVLRDIAGPHIDRIRVDNLDHFKRMCRFAEKYIPDARPQLEHYASTDRPIFDLYGVDEEIKKALDRKVMLKSGGYLIIDQTESMTTIDVNTGSFVGHRNLEETTFRTNLEAAQAIARQLRLRNLGGIIIIDFIDMYDPEHRRQVLRSLEKSLDKDYAKTRVCEVSELGLVEMTRKRTRESLEHILCEPCAVCDGRGMLKTPETVCFEILREILRLTRTYNVQQLMVLASQGVVDLLMGDKHDALVDILAESQEMAEVPIRFQVEVLYTQEQYDVVML